MDWKRENISASELEKRQKEFMDEALAMMKRSAVPGVPAEKPPAAEAARETPVPALTEESSDMLSHSEPAVPTEQKPDEQKPVEQKPDEQKPVEQKPDEQKPVEQKPVEQKPAELPGSDDGEKYGVYTADELMSGEYKGEGLKKAAEILEEMTRNTEMMKKLADGDDDPDITDFPDFSGGGPETGGSFREEENAECAPETEQNDGRT